jgi:hypothetical protein
MNIITTEPRLLSLIIPPASSKSFARYLNTTLPQILLYYTNNPPETIQRLNLVLSTLLPVNQMAATGVKIHIGLTDDGEWIENVTYNMNPNDGNLFLFDRKFHCL